MVVIFCNRFFWPDQSATAQMLSDVATHLAAAGHAVSVIASDATYGSDGPRLAAYDRVGQVEVHRVRTTDFGRGTTLGRMVDYATFFAGATWQCFRRIRRGDVLVAKTDPPLLSVPLAIVARVRGARLVAWQQDIYPEVAAAFGMRLVGGPAGAVLRWLRNRSLRRADAVVAIGAAMADRVIHCGVAGPRVHLIPNWCDDDRIAPVSRAENPLRAEWGFGSDALVVGYSGNLGRAHDIDTVLGAIQILAARGEESIKFLFVGGGFLHHRLATLGDEVDRRNVVTRPYQPRETLHLSLGVPDIHWMTLRPEFEGMIVPSKFYGAAASGRMLAFVGADNGEIGQIISRHGLGRCFAMGDSAGMADWLVDLRGRRAIVEQAGIAARRFIDEHGKKSTAMASWDALVKHLR